MTMSLLIGICPGCRLSSEPDGAMSSPEGLAMPLSKASRLSRPASVSASEPLGLKNSSKVDIAPLCLTRFLACSTWVVDLQLGPKICLATRRQEAVLPTPAGPVTSRWGGSGERLDELRACRVARGTASSSNLTGASVSSQLATRVGRGGGP
mgnify:CR=1 FL=1